MTDASVTRFSTKRLRCGDWRSIATLAGRGAPCATVARFRRGQIVSRVLIFPADVAVFERALGWVRAPKGERFDAGEYRAGKVNVRVFALAREGHERAVCFGRVGVEDGRYFGKATMLVGLELEALARALEHLKQIHRGEPATQRNAQHDHP